MDRSPNRMMAKQTQHAFDAEGVTCDVDKQATIAVLAAYLTHKIATPLGIIAGRSELILRAGEHQNWLKASHGLETILKQVDKITEALRELAELGAPEMTIREPHDVRQLVLSSADLFRNLFEHHQATCQFELGEAPLVVRCDPLQLRQIFINLFRNALDAMGERGILKVVAHRQNDFKRAIQIVFENSGEAEEVPTNTRILDPFSVSKEARPAVMRLAVAQSIARNHDGEIAYEGGGLGSRIVLSLPRAQLERGAPDPR